MTPTTPIVEGHDLPVMNFAEDQPEFVTLPGYRTEDGCVLTRWRLTWRERLRVLLTGDLYHWQETYWQGLQPICMTVKKPDFPKGEGDGKKGS